MSASWYTWLEQGRTIRVSETVLNAVAQALQLTSAERAHLYRLAGLNPPLAKNTPNAADVVRLTRIVEGWQPAPAYVIDRHWNVLAANDSARRLLGVRTVGHNFLTMFFTDPGMSRRYADWHAVAARFVGQFRAQAARFPGDATFETLVARLCMGSPKFSELWERHEVHGCAAFLVELRMANAGSQTYEHVNLGLFEGVDVSLMIYLPQTAAASATLDRLLAG